jgi:hypothetical protein
MNTPKLVRSETSKQHDFQFRAGHYLGGRHLPENLLICCLLNWGVYGFTSAGVQHIYDERNLLHAVAVQSGDLLPTPSTAASILVALGVITLTRRKRPH